MKQPLFTPYRNNGEAGQVLFGIHSQPTGKIDNERNNLARQSDQEYKQHVKYFHKIKSKQSISKPK